MQGIGKVRSIALAVGVALGTAAIGIAWSASGQDGEAPSMEELLEQAQPGPVHEVLAALEGDWNVVLSGPGGGDTNGEGSAMTILGERFLVIDFALGELGAAREFRYTLGFDRRHDEHSIVAMDTTGTYFVSARGGEEDGRILMRGTDDDPVMARMGFEKKFVFELELEDEDAFSISTFFVDTRTDQEALMLYGTYAFTRRAD